MAPKYNIHPDRKYSIAIAGGGIGGLCTAIGLLHQGVPVEIYEGQPTHPSLAHNAELNETAQLLPASQKSAQASPSAPMPHGQ